MIANHVSNAALIYLVLTIQPSLEHWLGNSIFCPWLPGIAIAICTTMTKGSTSLIWAGILGLGIDCLSNQRMGLHLMTATLMCLGSIAILQNNGLQRIGASGACVFSGTLIWRLITAIDHTDLRKLDSVSERCAIEACREGLSTAALLMGILLIHRLVTNWIAPRQTFVAPLSNRWSMLTNG